MFRSGYGEEALEVCQDQQSRWLQFGSGTIQTLMDRDRTQDLILPYIQSMMAALLFHDDPRQILLLGLGGGSMVRFLLHHQTSSFLHVVENQADCLHIAERFFLIAEEPRLQVTVSDARSAMVDWEPAQDLIFIDIFVAQGLPPWVCEAAFFQDCHRALNDTGIVIANLWLASDDEFLTVMDGIRTVFSQRTLLLVVEGYRNLIVLGFKSPPSTVSLPELYARGRTLRARTGIDFPRLLDTIRQANFVHDNSLII